MVVAPEVGPSRARTAWALAASLVVTACGAVDPASDASMPAAGSRPNILLIITDDQGYGDSSLTGNPILATPHIDALAAEGARVDRFYVNPVCAPTRASLLTGRYSQRTGVVDTYRGRAMMDPEEVTLAEVLTDAGYACGIFGKWHLGDCYPMRPVDQGFERSLVHRGGGLAQPSEPAANARRYTDAILFDAGEPVATRGYCTDVFFDAARDFIDDCARSDQPFFAYVATNAPHGPVHDVPADSYAKYRDRDYSAVGIEGDRQSDRVARIFAMIDNIDTNVGRILAHLDRRGLAEETIVIFLSDNGPEGRRFVGPMRGRKSQVFEGGIRTPFFVRWPGRIEPDLQVDTNAAHIDVMPTLLEAAGVDTPEGVALDGRSLLPLLCEDAVSAPAAASRMLFVQSHRGDAPRLNHNCAVIHDRWKLLRASGFGEQPNADARFALYDLDADPYERSDLAAARPEVVAVMRQAYADWFADIMTSRPNGFVPPRIVIGTEHEPVTTLTKQDWFGSTPGGWGQRGAWHLETRAAGPFEIRALFRAPTSIDAARITVGTRVTEIALAAEGDAIVLGVEDLPAGPVELMVECRSEGEWLAPYQVEVRRRD